MEIDPDVSHYLQLPNNNLPSNYVLFCDEFLLCKMIVITLCIIC
jgi:hypothetical protein